MRIYLFILALTLLTLSGCSIQLGGHHQDDDNNIKSHFGHLQIGGDKKPANVHSVNFIGTGMLIGMLIFVI